MYREYKETLPTGIQQIDNSRLKDNGVFVLPDKPLYHYTSREVFWKIMEEESFLARHILFSNDYEEYELGRNRVCGILRKNGYDTSKEAIDDRNHRYMICFCEKEDLLSQWRGYARNGIALEFDFSLGRYGMYEIFSPYHCFTLVNNASVNDKKIVLSDKDDKDEEKFKRRYISFNEKNTEGNAVLCVTAPSRIFYTGRQSNSADLKNVAENIRKLDSPTPVFLKLIPYIKNSQFDEEKEYRLIFDLWELLKTENEWIRNEKIVYLDVRGVKKPNIRIEFGNALEKLSETITVYYGNKNYQGALETLQKKLKDKNIYIEPAFYENTRLKPDEILLGNGLEQETVMRELQSLFLNNKDISNQTKVWCDGHFPLRKIIVGPARDAELMKKSILYYKQSRYWMKHVKVETSKIPFRD